MKDLFSKPLALAIYYIVLFSLSWIIPLFPLTLFIALVPLLALTRKGLDQGKVSQTLVFLFLALLTSQWIYEYAQHGSMDAGPFIVGTLMLGPFVLFMMAEKLTMPKVSHVLFLFSWISLEYAMMELEMVSSDRLLFWVFNDQLPAIGWIRYTGLLGISFWVVWVNILIYPWFADKKGNLNFSFSVPKVIYPLIVLIVPILISVFALTPVSLDFELLKHYPNHLQDLKPKEVWSFYLGTEEYFGRICSWFSVFIVLSLMVKHLRKGKVLCI